MCDLSAFDSLLDWSFGVERFVTSGDATLLATLMKENVKPIISESNGKNQQALNLSYIGRGLEKYTNIIATCRSGDISKQILSNKKYIYEYNESDILPAFKPLFKKIEQSFRTFTGNHVYDAIEASKWCLKHNYIQQGITILRETIITYIVSSADGDYMDEDFRDVAQSISNSLIYEESTDIEKFKKKPAISTEYIVKVTAFLKDNMELIKQLRNIGPVRNDINHAGCRKTPKPPESFRSELEKYISIFESIIQNQNV